jgi:hypothetical protein
MKVFEETEDSVSGLFSKSLKELEDRAEKGAKELEEQQKKEQEFVAEVYKSYMTPLEMLKLPAGDFFFFHSFFMKNVGGFMETFGWRYGQCFFNLLMDTNGRVGEMLRGSIRDPYHKDEVSEEVWNFLMDHWEG